MSLRQYLNVCYASLTQGMDGQERERVDMILEGRDQKEIIAKQNRRVLQESSIAAFIGQVA